MKNDNSLQLRLPRELKQETVLEAKRRKMKFSQFLRWALVNAIQLSRQLEA